MLRLHHSDGPLIDQLIRTAASYPAGSRPRALILDLLHQHRVAVAEKYKHIDFKPPESVANAAEKGLEYRDKQGKDKAGLTPSEASKEGIGSGVQRATNLKNRDTISPEVIRQMVGFFSRHEKNKSIAPEHKNEPWKDKGYVSWLLWGGDPGKAWAEKVLRQMEAADEKAKKTASENAPTNPKLWEKVQKLTKGEIKSLKHDGKTYEAPNNGKGFKPFPSWVANQWASKVYDELGGGWKKESSMKTAVQVRDHIIRVAHSSDPKTRARLLPLARKLVSLTKMGSDMMGWEYRRERGEAAYYQPEGKYRVLLSRRDGRWLIQERYGARWNTTGSQRYKDALAAVWDVERGKVASNKVAEGWSKLPKGWTQESAQKFWDDLTGDRKHKVTACIKKMEGKVDDAGAFCASLADMIEPGWREKSGSLPAGARVAGMSLGNEQVRFYFNTKHVISIRTAAIINDLASLPTKGDPVTHVAAPDEGGHVGITFGSGKSLTVHTDYREGPQQSPTKLANEFYAFLGDLAGDVSDEESDEILDALAAAMGASDIEPTLRSDWPEIPGGNRAARTGTDLSVGDHVELVSHQNTVGGVVPEGTTAIVTGLGGGPNNDKVIVKLDESVPSQPLTNAIPVDPFNLKKIACGCGCNCGGSCSCATDKVMEFATQNPDLASKVMPAISQ